MSAADLLFRARALVEEQRAIAAALRALPDDELLQLATKGAVVDPSFEAPQPTALPKKLDEVAPKPTPPPTALLRAERARKSATPNGQVLEAHGRKKRVLEQLRAAGGFVRSSVIARTLKEKVARISFDLRELGREGVAESNGRGGVGAAWRAVGRQTGAPVADRSSVSAQASASGRRRSGQAHQEILELLQGGPKTPVELAASLGVSTVWDQLNALRRQGKIYDIEGEGPAVVSLSPHTSPAAPPPKPSAEPSAQASVVHRDLKPENLPPPVLQGARPTDEATSRRAAIVAEVRARQPVRWDALVTIAAHLHKTRHMDQVALLKSRALFAHDKGPAMVVAVDPSLLPEADTRRLPMLEIGISDRRSDCLNYNDCLGRFVKVSSSLWAALSRGQKARLRRDGDADGAPARCPVDCADYAAESREERIAKATARNGSPLSLAGSN